MDLTSLKSALAIGGALHDLTFSKRFIVYKLVWQPEKGKHDKVPSSHLTGLTTNAHDTAIQTDWQTALTAAGRFGQDYGVGFVFVKADERFFLDIDKCREGDRWSDLANRLVQALPGAAIEVSVSGNGLHVFGRGTCPEHRSKNTALGLELYTDARFVALTGVGAVGNAAQDCSASLGALVNEYFLPTAASQAAFTWTDFKIPETEDRALINRMITSGSVQSFFGNKVAFVDLWCRNVEKLRARWPDEKRPFDESSADMALAQHLAFWTKKDCARMWRLMWHPDCKLRRDKWHPDNHKSYLQNTILTACAQQTEVVKDRMEPIKPGQPLPPNAVNATAEAVGREPKSICLTTDQANAKRIRDKFGTRIMNAAGGWYGWDGTRWVPDMTYVWECAQSLSDMVRDEAKDWRARAEIKKQIQDPLMGGLEDENAQKLEKYIPTCESRETKNAALDELAKLTAVDMDTIDKEPWLLNTLSGVVDLRDGTLHPHDSKFRMSKIAPVHYNPMAKCPNFERFLAEIMGEDTVPLEYRHKVNFLQTWFGYCATGKTNEQKFAVHWGGGANGKSTLIDIIATILGNQYSSEAAPGMLVGKTDSRHPTDIADLKGRRMVTSSETGHEETMREDFVKRATGGDRLKGRHMRQDFFEFIPTHKLQLLTNHKPRIYGTDYAIWRRVMLIPYNITFGSKEDVEAGRAQRIKDTNLGDKLKDEREGILAWLIRGAIRWHQDGKLDPPAEVVAATQSYRDSQDSIAQFVKEQCEIVPGASIAMHGAAGFSDCLYPRYQAWAKGNGMHALGASRFETELLRAQPGLTVATETRTSAIDGRTIKMKVVTGLR